MNRRNFILGLGTAATLSGAASVTGATIQNEVQPTANFQVVATDRLEIEKNDALDDTTMSSDGNYSTFLNPGQGNDPSDFAPTAADDGSKSFPNMTIDNGTNGELDMALATNTTNESIASYNRNGSTTAPGGPYPSSTPYSTADDSEGIPPLQIRNPGSNVNVSAEFYLDGDRDSGDADLVTQLFNFKIVDTDDTVIDVSPDVGASTSTDDGQTVVEPDTGDVAEIDGGKTDVHFELAMHDELADELANLASSPGALEFGDGSQTNVPLLDEVRFGVDSGGTATST